MPSFILPDWIKAHNFPYERLEDYPKEILEGIKNNLKKFNVDNPIVSIVIPAYNEEKDIIKTLSSISMQNIDYPTELIVANNNSKDRTQEILDLLEVKSVFVPTQGVSHARQAGLDLAKGNFIMSADADSIYPAGWTQRYVHALLDSDVSCVYGTYSFIPGNDSSRFSLGMYETASELIFALKRQKKECVNVMGFNSAFRKEDAVKVGGYDHTLQRHIDGRCEDGWMALCLSRLGKIKRITDSDVRVWTSDRRLMADGSIGNAFMKRIKKEVGRASTYFKAKEMVKV